MTQYNVMQYNIIQYRKVYTWGVHSDPTTGMLRVTDGNGRSTTQLHIAHFGNKRAFTPPQQSNPV